MNSESGAGANRTRLGTDTVGRGSGCAGAGALTEILASLVLVVAVLGAAFVLWKPRWAFALVMLMFPLKQLVQSYFVGQRGFNNYGPNVAVAALAAFALTVRLIRGERPLRPFWNLGTVLILLLYADILLSLAWTPSFDGALRLLGEGAPYHLLLLLVLPLLLEDLRDFRRMLTGVMLAGSVIAVLIMVNPTAQFSSGRLTLVIGTSATSQGGRGNPLAIAEMGGVMAICASLIRYERASRAFTVLRAAAFMLGLGISVLSGERGQTLAAAAIGVMFFPAARQVKNTRQFVVAVLGVTVMAVGVYATFKLFVGSANQKQWSTSLLTASLEERLTRVQTLVSAWAADPVAWVLGLGTNAYSAIDQRSSGTFSYVHNVAAEAFAEQGLIGAALFTGAVFFTFRSGRRLWSMYRYDPELRAAAAILGAMGAYSTILSLKQGCMIAMPAPFYWWMVIDYVAKKEMSRVREAQFQLQWAGEYDGGDAGELAPEEPIPAGAPEPGYAA